MWWRRTVRTIGVAYGDVLGVTTCRCSQWPAGCGNLMLLCDFVRGSLIEDY